MSGRTQSSIFCFGVWNDSEVANENKLISKVQGICVLTAEGNEWAGRGVSYTWPSKPETDRKSFGWDLCSLFLCLRFPFQLNVPTWWPNPISWHYWHLWCLYVYISFSSESVYIICQLKLILLSTEESLKAGDCIPLQYHDSWKHTIV